MKTISCFQIKGGVGKSFLVVQLGSMLADMGKRVLVIDTDVQSTLTHRLLPGHEGTAIRPSLRDVFDHQSSLPAAVRSVRDNLSIVPCDIRMDGLDEDLEFRRRQHLALREVLREVAESFDVCLIDLPGRMCPTSRAGLWASDGFLLPINPNAESVMTARTTMAGLERIMNPAPLLGVVCNGWRNTALAGAVERQARQHWRGMVFATTIGYRESLQKMALAGQTAADRPKSAAYEEFLQLSREVLKAVSREEKSSSTPPAAGKKPLVRAARRHVQPVAGKRVAPKGAAKKSKK